MHRDGDIFQTIFIIFCVLAVDGYINQNLTLHSQALSPLPPLFVVKKTLIVVCHVIT